MLDEKKKDEYGTPVENSAPANQQSVDGELVTGEKVEAVRWLDAKTQEHKYQVKFNNKLYMAKQVGTEPSKFVYELL